jgi:hypothetical protein
MQPSRAWSYRSNGGITFALRVALRIQFRRRIDPNSDEIAGCILPSDADFVTRSSAKPTA